MKWLSKEWYKYLFKGCKSFANLICRIKGHPHGVVWFNSVGLEPDMHCKNCGEDLS